MKTGLKNRDAPVNGQTTAYRVLCAPLDLNKLHVNPREKSRFVSRVRRAKRSSFPPRLARASNVYDHEIDPRRRNEDVVEISVNCRNFASGSSESIGNRSILPTSIRHGSTKRNSAIPREDAALTITRVISRMLQSCVSKRRVQPFHYERRDSTYWSNRILEIRDTLQPFLFNGGIFIR